MKWWKKALIATAVLIVLDAGLALTLFQHIHNTSVNTQIESVRHEQLGELCGQIFGFGTIIIWFGGYVNQMKKRAA